MINEIDEILVAVIFYVIGCFVTFLLCNPKKSFNDGFNQGWDAFKDYVEDIIKKAEEEEKNAEIQRDSAGT